MALPTCHLWMRAGGFPGECVCGFRSSCQERRQWCVRWLLAPKFGRFHRDESALPKRPCGDETTVSRHRCLEQYRRDSAFSYCYRKTKQTTPEVIRSGPPGEYPRRSLAALQKLADWYHASQSTRQGGQACADPDPGQSPPASSSAQPSANPTADLDDAPRRAPSHDAPDAQSSRGTPALRPAQPRGGVA